jgi:FkbM family methyltransferase
VLITKRLRGLNMIAASLVASTLPEGPLLLPPSVPNWCPHGRTLAKMLRRRPSGFVIDVGSFDGRDAIAFAKAGHRVWTIEPSPGKVEPIRERIASLGLAHIVTVFPYAMSNTTGTAPFVVNRAGQTEKKMFRGELGSAQDGLGKALWNVDNKTAAVVHVPVRTLDAIVPSAQDVLLLKVDAQGYDYQVLLGAQSLLATKRIRRLVAELWPLHMPGGPGAAVEMIEYLNRLGYSCYRCDGPDMTIPGLDIRGKPVSVRTYADQLARKDKGQLERGVNVGRWDDVVCEPSGMR